MDFKANEKLVHPTYGVVEYKHEVIDDGACAIEIKSGKRIVVRKDKLERVD